jgi:hypothetical protein
LITSPVSFFPLTHVWFDLHIVPTDQVLVGRCSSSLIMLALTLNLHPIVINVMQILFRVLRLRMIHYPRTALPARPTAPPISVPAPAFAGRLCGEVRPSVDFGDENELEKAHRC